MLLPEKSTTHTNEETSQQKTNNCDPQKQWKAHRANGVAADQFIIV